MSESSVDLFRAIFLRWERWRIWYNFALAFLVVILAIVLARDESDWPRLVAQCFFGAIFTNICYFAGPIAESYLQWLGLRSRAITPVIFASGLLSSMLLAALFVSDAMSPSEF